MNTAVPHFVLYFLSPPAETSKLASRTGKKNAPALSSGGTAVFTCGGEEIRTPVQTYSPKAFYMLIPALIVGQ